MRRPSSLREQWVYAKQEFENLFESHMKKL